MREIKFRAWDGKRYQEVAISQCGKAMSFDTFEYYPADDWLIEQYTGLCDKNGKEIYEGDIVYGDKTNGWVESIKGIATFMGSEFCLTNYPYCKDGWSDYNLWYVSVSSPNPFNMDVEIIGNIHENSDLLK